MELRVLRRVSDESVCPLHRLIDGAGAREGFEVLVDDARPRRRFELIQIVRHPPEVLCGFLEATSVEGDLGQQQSGRAIRGITLDGAGCGLSSGVSAVRKVNG